MYKYLTRMTTYQNEKESQEIHIYEKMNKIKTPEFVSNINAQK